MRFDIEIGQASQRGPRPANEDFAAAAMPQSHEAERGLVAAIADGVSGGGGGREAAQTSVLGLVADYHAVPDTWDTSVVLDRLIGAQNAWLANHNRRRQLSDAGSAALSTLTALVLRGQSWTVAHVGDTRAWLLRDGTLSQLTQDHAFEEAFQRSRLQRALGLDDLVRIDFEQGEARVGDLFLLTSDGVHGALPRATLLGLLSQAEPAQALAQAIVAAALKAGSRDNATALVLQIRGLDSAGFADSLLAGHGLPPLRRLRLGEAIDGLVVTADLADTGVHRLYQARDQRDGSLVVIKALHESRASDQQERAMLVHEAWVSGRAAAASGTARSEAAFIATRSVDQPSAFYTVYAWHAGRTLEAMLAGGQPQAVPDIVAGAVAVAHALARLHRLGVIHRDIKPGNLYLGDDGRWRVLDLGAALSGSDPEPLRLLRSGTPSYMNPEQWGLHGGNEAAEPQAADAGSDLFALGVTLYQWLTGKLPYGEVEPYQTGRYRRDPKPASRLRPDVPIWLDHIVLKAVALDPRQRFESAEELALALERGAARPLGAPQGTPLVRRDPAALWKIAFATSLLFNLLLIYWLLFLPR